MPGRSGWPCSAVRWSSPRTGARAAPPPCRRYPRSCTSVPALRRKPATSSSSPGRGRTASASAGVIMNAEHLAHDDLVGRRGFVGLAAQLGKLSGPVRGTVVPQDLLGRGGAAPARGKRPQGHQAHIPVNQGGRVEQRPQISPGRVLEQLAVFAQVDRVGETVRAADSDRAVRAASDRGPAERARDAADAGGVEHLYRATAVAGPDTRGEPVHVRLGRGRQHRARDSA